MKRYFMGIIAIAIALTFSAFDKTEHTKNQKNAELLWYEVTYDVEHPNGYIPNGSAFYDSGEKVNILSPCDAGTAKDCLRGFSSTPSFPTGSTGEDQIKRPN